MRFKIVCIEGRRPVWQVIDRYTPGGPAVVATFHAEHGETYADATAKRRELEARQGDA